MRDVDWFRRPEMILADLIRKAGRGEKDRHYHRAVVLAVDLDGGKLQNPDAGGQVSVSQRDGSTKTFKAIAGPLNPRGSIKARILSDGFDRLLDDQQVRVFWPMFPQDLAGTPATPGEHVYVIFEGEGMAHGLWVSRVAGHESANSYDGAQSYVAPSAPQSAMDSYEDNPAQYPKDDHNASLAPSPGAMANFEDD